MPRKARTILWAEIHSKAIITKTGSKSQCIGRGCIIYKEAAWLIIIGIALAQEKTPKPSAKEEEPPARSTIDMYVPSKKES